MEAKEILDLNFSRAKSKFGTNLKSEVTKLIRLWHPDVCKDPQAREVTEVLMRLRSQAAARKPKSSPLREFISEDGKRFGVRPVSTFMDAHVEVMVCEHSILRLYKAEDADLAGLYVSNVSSFRFADANMETQMRRFLPSVPKVRVLHDGSVMHVHKRDADQLPLRDLLAFKGNFDARSVAWVISGLLNITCWTAWTDRVHGAVSPESVLVSPETHALVLLGGWEFCVPVGQGPVALPESTLILFPGLAGKTSKMTVSVDLSLIRETLMRMIGVTHLSGMLSGSCPKPISLWAGFPAVGTAQDDYKAWEHALAESYGKPKFIKMGITPEDVYEDA